MQQLVESAPKLIDHLGEASLAHLAALRSILDEVGVEYLINPRLVRGLDYYNLTVFEWTTERLGAQGTVCGGGRYDLLIERLGGKPAPAVGYALGLERLLLLLDHVGLLPVAPAPAAYAIVASQAVLPRALVAIEALRAQGVAVLMNAAGKDGPGSIKSQFKRADASGARYALIFGDHEMSQGQVSVKPLRDAQAAQVLRPLDGVAQWAALLLTA